MFAPDENTMTLALVKKRMINFYISSHMIIQSLLDSHQQRAGITECIRDLELWLKFLRQIVLLLFFAYRLPVPKQMITQQNK